MLAALLSAQLTAQVCLQDIYCFVLPLVLKWVAAALVASVLVDLFRKLTGKGDKVHIHVHERIQAMVQEGWQQRFWDIPSNTDMLLTLFRLNRKRKSLKLLPSFLR